MDQSKTCPGCRTTKPTTDFYRMARAKDGLQVYCKSCKKERDGTPQARAYRREYQARNAERSRENKRRHYLANRDAYINRAKAAYRANPDAGKRRAKEHEQRNPYKKRQRTAQYRARLKLAKRFEVSTRDIARLLNQPCIYCGTVNRISIDHVLPLSRGGHHGIGNLASACLSCNASKRDRTVMEWRMGKAPTA